MTFNVFTDGVSPASATTAMENWRHVNYGNNLIPVDSVGAGSNGTLDLGSSSYKWNNAYINTGIITTNIYSVAWTDYSSTSTVSGWAATPTKYIFYKKIGKLVILNFQISGTSNSVTCSFTLPNAMTATNCPLIVGRGRGVEGSTDVGCDWYLQTGVSASLVELFKNGFANFSNSGAKAVYGTIVYETT